MRSSFRVIVTKIAEQDMRVTRDFTYSLYCQLSLSLSGSYSAIARLTGHLLGTAGCRIASHSPVFDSHLFLLASVHPSIPSLGISHLHQLFSLLFVCLATMSENPPPPPTIESLSLSAAETKTERATGRSNSFSQQSRASDDSQTAAE